MPGLTVAQLAEVCGAQAEGDAHRSITGANSLEKADSNELAFAANRKAIEAASSSRAGCLLVPSDFKQQGTWSLLRVANPRAAFGVALGALYPKKQWTECIHPTAIIAPSAKIGSRCFVGAYATVGEGTQVGSGCWIGDGCAIADNVSIDNGTMLYPHVTVYSNVRIGARVILHSGCVLGADGFGFTFVQDHFEKFPQVGTLEIGDDVEIGANCCIDRAALGITRIGEGTKLDNLVHVAHNCSIGKHVVIAAQTGFSGSVTVGDYAVIGGQAGIGEKATIEPRAIVGGKAGILTSQVVHAGEPVWGIPARPLRKHLKGLALVSKLPELRAEVTNLKSELAKLKQQSTANAIKE